MWSDILIKRSFNILDFVESVGIIIRCIYVIHSSVAVNATVLMG